ncbi:hypothetical protein PIB30_018165 [Stylosanthes scabra]|uniref:Uncharacterized protein n=1 Tax=Stylosanthes scabra TaxID=79078 RepID=A0ABU6R840_9FABA|nr:hypothetical protein [Stylosanthes scabra]
MLSVSGYIRRSVMLLAHFFLTLEQELSSEFLPELTHSLFKSNFGTIHRRLLVVITPTPELRLTHRLRAHETLFILYVSIQVIRFLLLQERSSSSKGYGLPPMCMNEGSRFGATRIDSTFQNEFQRMKRVDSWNTRVDSHEQRFLKWRLKALQSRLLLFRVDSNSNVLYF